jgi:tRNA(Arg) A34 adenosine deaminase TadA
VDAAAGDEQQLAEDDELLLRRALALARRARAAGNHPFGALLADGSGAVLLEAGNEVVSARDPTAHAELLLARAAGRRYAPDVLSACSLFSSTEPCAMCAGAAYWVGIGRVVYGLAEAQLLELTGAHGENPTMRLGCRPVFGAGQRATTVLGPALVAEARAVHEGFWG